LLERGEWFDIAFLPGQHVRQRPEVGEVEAPVAHRFDHRRVVGGHDQLDLLAEFLLQQLLQRLVVLDDRGSVLVWQ